jgi:hypothetical protein
MRRNKPLQNALFLLIPASYVAGWTLVTNPNEGAEKPIQTEKIRQRISSHCGSLWIHGRSQPMPPCFLSFQRTKRLKSAFGWKFDTPFYRRFFYFKE